MNDFAHSARARAARLAKADALANLMLQAGGSWPETEHDRRVAERAAGVRPSSEETWALARRFYEDTRASRERVSS